MKTPRILLALAAAAWLIPVDGLRASDFPSHWVGLPHASGLHNHSGPGTNLAWSVTLEAPGATWLRVEFNDCHLGAGSHVLLISEANQTSHRLNAVSMQQWSKCSGALKGGRVRVELHVAPGDSNVFASVSRVLAGERPSGFFPATLCDGDSRVNTRDDRVGRMFGGGCTAWLVSNGAVCSAGHCVSGGPGSFFEVNVPASDADGSVEINNFGLMPHAIGRGFGRFLLTRSVQEAWAMGAKRVWLHTCTLDHPSALPNYLKRGFRVIGEERYATSVP